MEIKPNRSGEALASIDREVFSKPWTASSFPNQTGRISLVLEKEGQVVAYIYGSQVAGEAEIWRIATLPSHRRQGIASQLLKAFEAECRRQEASEIFLEVSALNPDAICFYQHHGFEETGRRKNYYGPNEDAILMRKEQLLG